MAFKIVFIIAIACLIQSWGKSPKKPGSLPPNFQKHLDSRDNFGEAVTLYEMYPALLNQSNVVAPCYKNISEDYKKCIENTLRGLDSVVELIKNENVTLPLKRLKKALNTYPEKLSNFMKLSKLNETATLVRETAGKVIFFDIRSNITMNHKKYKKSIDKEVKKKFKKVRDDAKAKGEKISKELRTCMNINSASTFSFGASDESYFNEDEK